MSAEYHLRELRVALDPADPRHVAPPTFPQGHRILDVGCGAGQTLIASYPDRISFGVDIDHEALTLGTTLTQQVRFARARVEALPFADEQFDVVVARVSLIYSDMNVSLAEIGRVLKPGGVLWMTLHTFSRTWTAAKAANFRGKLFFLYILANSLSFHFFQKHFPALGKYESFQTEHGVRLALERHGFEEISISCGRHFVGCAKKLGG